MRSDEITDRNSGPCDQGEADLDLAALFKRSMPVPPAADIDRLLASFERRSAARESPAARASRRSTVLSRARNPFMNRRIRMATKVAAVLVLAIPAAVVLLLLGPGG